MSVSQNTLLAIVLWIVTGVAVFVLLDALATRHVPVHVETFRMDGMTDEEVVTQAVQAAYRIEDNDWWIHDKQPYLVFDTSRTYDIDLSLYGAFDLRIVYDRRNNMIGLIDSTDTMPR